MGVLKPRVKEVMDTAQARGIVSLSCRNGTLSYLNLQALAVMLSFLSLLCFQVKMIVVKRVRYVFLI